MPFRWQALDGRHPFLEDWSSAASNRSQNPRIPRPAALELDLSALRDVPVTVSVQHEAIRAMCELAAKEPLAHRVPMPDVLIAATAQEAGVAVLHLDRHFDRLATVLAFDSRWAADPTQLG